MGMFLILKKKPFKWQKKLNYLTFDMLTVLFLSLSSDFKTQTESLQKEFSADSLVRSSRWFEYFSFYLNKLKYFNQRMRCLYVFVMIL